MRFKTNGTLNHTHMKRRYGILCFILGFCHLKLTAARCSSNTIKSERLGEIQYRPPRYRADQEWPPNTLNQRDCVWSFVPKEDEVKDYVLILKVFNLDYYNQGDTIRLPDNSTLYQSDSTGRSRNYCHKYISSSNQSRTCLQNLAIQFCPGVNTTFLNESQPLKFSVSTQPTLDSKGNFHYFTRFSVAYTILVCPAAKNNIQTQNHSREDGVPTSTQPHTKPDEYMKPLPTRNTVNRVQKEYLASTIAASLLALIIIIAIIWLVLSRMNKRRKRSFENEDGNGVKSSKTLKTNYLGANITLQLASTNPYDNPMENISLYDDMDEKESLRSERDEFTVEEQPYEVLEATSSKMSLPYRNTFRRQSLTPRNGFSVPSKPTSQPPAPPTLPDTDHTYSVVNKK